MALEGISVIPSPWFGGTNFQKSQVFCRMIPVFGHYVLTVFALFALFKHSRLLFKSTGVLTARMSQLWCNLCLNKNEFLHW